MAIKNPARQSRVGLQKKHRLGCLCFFAMVIVLFWLWLFCLYYNLMLRDPQGLTLRQAAPAWEVT
jgi:hypothetical protein